jgi:transposase-like protein
MDITLKEIIGMVKELPEKYFEEAYKKLTEIKEKAESEKESKEQSCPHCGSEAIVRNGQKQKKLAYLCRDCRKSFVQTTHSAIEKSHSSESVWKQVIRDTVDGISIDKTAKSLDLSHSTVFNMRHKILFCVEKTILSQPIELSGVCQTDETYVLENEKGRKFSKNHHRKPRKHGAKASKAGISNEYVCVCTSVTGDNQNMAISVNRAMPSKSEIVEVFADKITEDTLILCDGNTNYEVLGDKCTIAHTERINKVNGFHSFIKERIRSACGVATIYLNRYNMLFSSVFGCQDSIADKIYSLMTARNNSFSSIAVVKSQNLLNL